MELHLEQLNYNNMIRVYIKNNKVLKVEDADVQIVEMEWSVTDTISVLNGSPYIITDPKEIEIYESEQGALLLEKIYGRTSTTVAPSDTTTEASSVVVSPIEVSIDLMSTNTLTKVSSPIVNPIVITPIVATKKNKTKA